MASNPTAVIIPQPPAATAAPGIAGTATNLQTLAATLGSWTNNPTKFAYAWQDCDASGANCTAISGATASTYTLALSDVGDTIRVAVTATNAGGSATATSAPTAVIAPVLTPWANTPVPGLLAAPAVSGSAAVGATLTCATGRWSGSPTSYEYQWNRGNAPVLNATAATVTATAADRGQALSCTVTAINSGGAIQADSARITIPTLHKAETPEQAPPGTAPARADPSAPARPRRPRRAAGRHTAATALARPRRAATKTRLSRPRGDRSTVFDALEGVSESV